MLKPIPWGRHWKVKLMKHLNAPQNSWSSQKLCKTTDFTLVHYLIEGFIRFTERQIWQSYKLNRQTIQTTIWHTQTGLENQLNECMWGDTEKARHKTYRHKSAAKMYSSSSLDSSGWNTLPSVPLIMLLWFDDHQDICLENTKTHTIQRFFTN